MGTALSLPKLDSNYGLLEKCLPSLLEERDQYRRKYEMLARANKLHMRLAGKIEPRSMIEAFSTWLMSFVPHKMLGYINQTQRMHYISCSIHGPEKKMLLRAAQRATTKLSAGIGAQKAFFRQGPYFVRVFRVGPAVKKSYLLIFSDNVFPIQFEGHLQQGIQIFHESIERGFEYADLYEQARLDSLTGLANRRVFEERLGPLMESAKRHKRPITLLSMDLDRFKSINDTYGHAEGDRILRLVAREMARLVRASDILVRMGGDEFLLLLPDTNSNDARQLANRLCNKVHKLQIKTPVGSQLGVSIGIAQWQEKESKDEWLAQADEALYQAKKNGRGCLYSL